MKRARSTGVLTLFAEPTFRGILPALSPQKIQMTTLSVFDKPSVIEKLAKHNRLSSIKKTHSLFFESAEDEIVRLFKKNLMDMKKEFARFKEELVQHKSEIESRLWNKNQLIARIEKLINSSCACSDRFCSGLLETRAQSHNVYYQRIYFRIRQDRIHLCQEFLVDYKRSLDKILLDPPQTDLDDGSEDEVFRTLFSA